MQTRFLEQNHVICIYIYIHTGKPDRDLPTRSCLDDVIGVQLIL